MVTVHLRYTACILNFPGTFFKRPAGILPCSYFGRVVAGSSSTRVAKQTCKDATSTTTPHITYCLPSEPSWNFLPVPRWNSDQFLACAQYGVGACSLNLPGTPLERYILWNVTSCSFRRVVGSMSTLMVRQTCKDATFTATLQATTYCLPPEPS